MARQENNINKEIEKKLMRIFKKHKKDFGFDDTPAGRFFWYSNGNDTKRYDIYFEINIGGIDERN